MPQDMQTENETTFAASKSRKAPNLSKRNMEISKMLQTIVQPGYWRDQYRFFECERLRSQQINPEKNLLATDLMKTCEKAVREYFRRRLPTGNPDRMLKIGWMRFVQDKTLQQVGDAIGLTRERVRQIEARLIRIIRSTIKENWGL